MTRLEFAELFENEIKPLWPDWNPEEVLVDLYTDDFARYDSLDVRQAFRRHKSQQDFKEPKIPLVMKHLRVVVGERKAEERKRSAGNEWPGQVFIVVHTDPSGQVDFFRDFHIASIRAQIPKPFDSQRLNQHIDAVKETYRKQHPFGCWSGEIHTEETAQKRILDIRAGWTAAWVKKVYASPKPVAKLPEDVHRLDEVVQENYPTAVLGSEYPG